MTVNYSRKAVKFLKKQDKYIIDKGERAVSAVKERILGAVTVMSEEDAAKVWETIIMQFGIPAAIPTDEEIEIINSYKKGHHDFLPYITHNLEGRYIN